MSFKKWVDSWKRFFKSEKSSGANTIYSKSIKTDSVFTTFGNSVNNFVIKFTGDMPIMAVCIALLMGSLVVIFSIECFNVYVFRALKLGITILAAVLTTSALSFAVESTLQHHSYMRLGIFMSSLVFIYFTTHDFVHKPCIVKLPQSHKLNKETAVDMVNRKLEELLLMMESEQKICLDGTKEEVEEIYESIVAQRGKRFRHNFELHRGYESFTGKKKIKRYGVRVDPMSPNHAYYMDNYKVAICDSTGDSTSLSFHYLFQNIDSIKFSIDTIEEIKVDSFKVVASIDNNIRWVRAELDYPHMKDKLLKTFHFYALKPSEVFVIYWEDHWKLKTI